MSRTLGAATLLVSTALALTACAESDPEAGDLGAEPAEQPTTLTAAPAPTESQQSLSPPGRPRVVSTVATGLEVPWGVTFLPDGSALVGERDSTRVVRVSPGGTVREVGRVDEAAPQGEAGLLGLAASPSYDEDSSVYAYVTTGQDNRVVRMRYENGRLGDPEPILTGIPKGAIHDGGRLLFDEEDQLFVSTGETGEPELAQQTDSLGGKILRITAEGDSCRRQPPRRLRGLDAGSPKRAGARLRRRRADCGPPSSARRPGTS